MKLVITVLCLALSGAIATPFYGATDQENQPINAVYQEQSLFYGALDQEEPSFNGALYQEGLMSNNAIQQDEQESDTNQDMGQDDEEEQPTADVQLFPPRVVVQGSTIALQSVYDKRTWLSCSTPNCHKHICPLLYMDPHDWTTCWGEVFQIYRQGGKGAVRVGDVIGLHYPHEHGKWFSMFQDHGHKDPCPGSPNLSTGFANKYKWFQCWGEVFKIFARGYDGKVKSHGEVIKEHDIIMLCYIHSNKFVGFFDVANLQICPGPALPPPANKYDQCWGEVAELWLR